MEMTSDAALVSAATAGDESAFRQLYRAYVRPVFWIAHGIVGSPPDAEDVAQETFVVAWRRLPDLALEGDSLLPWLATICRFQAANRLRRIRRDRDHQTAHEDPIPSAVSVEQQVIASDLAERILAEVASLGEVDRDIFRLCVTEGYGYRAAAEEIGIAHGSVRNRLSRLRTRLRGAIPEESGS
ncbi:RNA polymerase sigma factor [Microbacterium sp. gxy059]|uniref:RNA polymerase sigma factor n=1 Tax=Microbacterium sp. gxy059 TaxID=2957199 RepID=UPI003D9964D2